MIAVLVCALIFGLESAKDEVKCMRRFAMTIKVKPGSANEYKKYHAAVWPEVLGMIRECQITNYSIYFKDDRLFGYFEYQGKDLDEDFRRMFAHKETQEWRAIMETMLEPLPTRREGEWWAEMEEVFHFD